MIVYERRASAVLYNVLRALGQRGTFLLPANVCPVVPATFVAAERPFVLMDIAEPWLGMNVERCLAWARASSAAGVLYVRTYGTEIDPTPLFAALREVREDLLLIDDKCLCRPDCDGASVSPLADMTLFSTGHGKYVDLAHGGFAHLRSRVAYRRQQSSPEWLDLSAPDLSWNEYRERVVAEASAADAQKAALNAIYANNLPAEVQLPTDFQRWRFNIRVPQPDRLVDSAFASGLFASRHYAASPVHPVAAQLHAEVVNLFNDRYFDAERALKMTDVVRRHLDLMRG